MIQSQTQHYFISMFFAFPGGSTKYFVASANSMNSAANFFDLRQLLPLPWAKCTPPSLGIFFVLITTLVPRKFAPNLMKHFLLSSMHFLLEPGRWCLTEEMYSTENVKREVSQLSSDLFSIGILARIP